jgi:hypothetical protein
VIERKKPFDSSNKYNNNIIIVRLIFYVRDSSVERFWILEGAGNFHFDVHRASCQMGLAVIAFGQAGRT